MEKQIFEGASTPHARYRCAHRLCLMYPARIRAASNARFLRYSGAPSAKTSSAVPGASLRRALGNLIENASKHGKPPIRVITLRQGGGRRDAASVQERLRGPTVYDKGLDGSCKGGSACGRSEMLGSAWGSDPVVGSPRSRRGLVLMLTWGAPKRALKDGLKSAACRHATQLQGVLHRLSITHISCSSDFGADFDIGQSREPAPDDGVTWRWVA